MTPIVALVLALVAMTSTLAYGGAATFAVTGTLCVFAVGLSYFALHSHHHLVADAPEEEVAFVRRAEAELD